MPTSDAAAEAAQLETLLAQERDIQFDSFGYADAWTVGSRLVELATSRGLSTTTSLVFGDQRVFHSALEAPAPTTTIGSRESSEWFDDSATRRSR